ncbi:MAG: ABC transporter substrate-binding protein [Candidatus Latescibacterota bacterium]|nr:ABC transporter substrate-binding protein [Candidatus Latescibacterota bacterium]
MKRSVIQAPRSLAPTIFASRQFGESPALAILVSQKKLPPVSERLPANPLVVIPVEKIGKYGGTIRRALTGDIVQTAGVTKTLKEGLLGFTRPIASEIEPNIAESFEFRDGGRSALFKIREGIRWSDGVLFTVDDILFWYYDMMLNDDARNSPLLPNIWLSAGSPLEMEKIDSHTLRVYSEKPMGRVLNALAQGDMGQPKHVLSRSHPKYNPKAKYEDFRDRTTTAQLLFTPGMPSLSAWAPVDWLHGQRIVFERNPYYWKVDSAGNQLPYADRITFTVIQDPDVIMLKFLSGELDLFGRYSRIDMYPTLKSEEGRGKFKLHLSSHDGGPAYYPNWDAHRKPLAEAFRDIRVRIAMSHAINREEINQVLFHGLLQTHGYSFGPLNPYFSDEAAQTYASFDPDKSRRLFDEAGFTDSDGDGVRELRDGSPFAFNLDVTASLGSDVSELVAAHWEEVGLKVSLDVGLRDILFPRRVNGEFEVHHWNHLGPADPFAHLNSWSIAGATLPFWHRNASNEAPEWLLESTRHVNAAFTTVDSMELRGHLIRIRDLHTEHVPIIVVGSPLKVWGASVRLGNVPEDVSPLNEHRGWSRPVFHEQLYIRPQ